MNSKNCVFVISPYCNKNKLCHKQNIQFAKLCLSDSIKRNESAFASHLLYPQVLNNKNSIERDLSIQDGLEWLNKSDFVVCYVDRGITNGMKICLDRAKLINKLIFYRRISYPQKLYIIVSGKRCSGKSQVANLIKKYVKSHTTYIQKFHDIVVNDFCQDINIQPNEYNKKIHKKDTEIFIHKKLKNKGNSYYLHKIMDQLLENGITIIADNKLTTICDYFIEHHRQNTLLVKVNSPNSSRSMRGWISNDILDNNVIETDLDKYNKFDVEINNNGNLYNLDFQVKNLIVDRFLLNKQENNQIINCT